MNVDFENINWEDKKYWGIPKNFITERNFKWDRRTLRSHWLKLLKYKHKYLLKDWIYNSYRNRWEYDFFCWIPWDIVSIKRESKQYKLDIERRRKKVEKKILERKAKVKKMLEAKKKKKEKLELKKWSRKLLKEHLKREESMKKVKEARRVKVAKKYQGLRIPNVKATINVKYRFKLVNSIVQDDEGTYWRIPFKTKGKIYGAVRLNPTELYLYNKIDKTWLLSDLERSKYPKKGKINTVKILQQLKSKA